MTTIAFFVALSVLWMLAEVDGHDAVCQAVDTDEHDTLSEIP